MQTGPAEQPLTLLELDALLAEDQCFEERRSRDRVEYRNRAQVICLRPDCPTIRSDVSLVWTDDVSTTGTRLLLPSSFTEERFWIRFSGANPPDPFIECRIQWRDDFPTEETSRQPEALHLYGVQFQRLLTRDEFAQLLTSGHSRLPDRS
jgi:hypothetical protein